MKNKVSLSGVNFFVVFIVPKLNYIHLKLFLVASSNFAIFSCIMSLTFESSQDILHLET